MSSTTSLSGYWAGVCKLLAEVDGASLLTTYVGVGVPPGLEAGVCVAEIVAAIDCVGPTTVDCVGPTAVDCVGPTAVVEAVDVSKRYSGLTLSKYFLFLVCAMPLSL